MSSQALISHGMSVSFSGFAAEIVDIQAYGGAQREAVDVTHQGSGNYMQFKPAPIVSSTDVTITCAFYGSQNPDTLIRGAAGTLTITEPIPDGLSNGATYAATAFITAIQPSATHKAKIATNVTWKITGGWTFTPAS